MVREMFFRLETEFMRGSTFDVKMKDARLHSSNSSLFYYLQVEIRARNDEQALNSQQEQEYRCVGMNAAASRPQYFPSGI